ncbi:MAG: hypothetical protein UT66_C0041G0013 [candidate division CPR2 bacterium GW2011_GWC1_39_9]|uniref:Uncharacterized protein n=1 Tax=candidate division CPR2 bacterium GW2011_GWC2_39_10 TaxID=1618345 RepID=A0A0G0LNM1_UNCC2|nr:MAG: hypothetical protein UT18_C0019G0005 [candidate division CPR2 bacterium GW2011_GWC2_39_10]KKR33322.1 MAG: hypothetical protein UT66_C0041G0013 [candidate division CPR2 bacterium GW2011_GWC1_39_9]
MEGERPTGAGPRGEEYFGTTRPENDEQFLGQSLPPEKEEDIRPRDFTFEGKGEEFGEPITDEEGKETAERYRQAEKEEPTLQPDEEK